MRNLLLLLALPALLFCQIPGLKENRVLLPNGWWLSPAGDQIPMHDFPMNAALSDDGAFLAVLHNGYSKPMILLVDLAKKSVVDTVHLKDGWLGIRFVGSTLYVSGAAQNCVYILTLKGGHLVPSDTIRLETPSYVGTVGGIDIHGRTLAAVCRQDSTLRFIDLKSREQKKIRLPGMPYACTYSPTGSLLVSLGGSKLVLLWEVDRLAAGFPTGDHPTEIVTTKNGRYAFVANANDNSVSVLDLISKTTVSHAVTATDPGAPEGSTPNSLALTPDEKTLLVANADNNSLTVIDVANPMRPSPAGFIPVGWYPTKVLVLKDRTVLVLNGKGVRSLANPKKEYIGSLLKGTLSFIPMPDEKQLGEFSRQVYANTPYTAAQMARTDIPSGGPIPSEVGDPSPIKHVLYIIKENRTYDQVFGDLRQGNGEPSLCLFPDSITPNHHKLVRQFTLFDNFYVNSEVSADGHNWSTAAYATDFVEKTWRPHYGGRGGEYNFEGGEPNAVPTAGYIWDQCKRAHVSYRSYGEFISAGKKVGDPGKPNEPGLEGHFAPLFRPWDLDYSDVDRYREWERELTQYEKNGDMPQFSIMHLPNDHTYGTTKGKLTPQAFVAQNDYALGLIVDRLSRSPYWKETAVFVTEDDAQDGPDHVDAHRSIALVISPYTKRNVVDHTLYTTASMLRTMELILGLPPMSQYDAAATPMFDAFNSVPDTGGYSVERPRYDLTRKNKPGEYGQNLLKERDFKIVDAIPERLFNEILWRAVKGTAMPAPRYSILSRRTGDND
jgi:YVTN family beta-propeller protein